MPPPILSIHVSPPDWVDPEDEPEWTAELFAKATPMIGEREVTWEEYRRAAKERVMALPPYENSKVSFVFRVDADILEAFAATGDDWESRMNDALRAWMKTNLPS